MTSSMQDTYEVTDEPPTIGTSLAVRPTEAHSIQDVRAAMALRDDEQVLSACQGAIIREWIYSFTIGGKEVTGISVTGAAEIARIRAEAGFPIRFPVVAANEVKRNEKFGLEVYVTARDQVTGGEAVALVFEPYFDDKGRPNPFVERKALSKAKRNAILDLIPEQQVIQLLKAAKASASGKVERKPVPPRREVARAVQPPKGPAAGALPGTPDGQPMDTMYKLSPSNEAQMAQIAQLAEHPANAPVKKQVMRGLDDNIYDTYTAAQDCIERLQKRILDPSPAA